MKRTLNRAERLHRLLKRGWLSSLDIIHAVGTVKPTNAVSELRRSGVRVERKVVAGISRYRVA